MISTADALEIMGIVAGCHPRTAPRVDDREAALITASIWAELFAEFDFTVVELIQAVKTRAKFSADAPEVADIIRVARSARNEHLARTVTVAPEEPTHHRGDSLASSDAPYPADWDADRRVSTYWYAVRLHAIPRTTKGWQALAEQHDREHRKAS